MCVLQKELIERSRVYFQQEAPIIMAEQKEDDKKEMAAVEKMIRGMGHLVYKVKKIAIMFHLQQIINLIFICVN